MKLTDHPRLFASQDDLDNLRRGPTLPAMVAAHANLIGNARKWLRNTAFSGWGLGQDPSGLGKARELIDRIITLTVACRKTGAARFRRGALDYIRTLDAMKSVEFRDENRVQGLWLSDGEEAAGLAIVYDWLYDRLAEEEREELLAISRKRLFALGLAQCRKGGAWWFNLRFSNWNAVCAGGLGMLCLAMYEECPEARKILPHVEETLSEFMIPLRETDGGWPEGLGYWNYGMMYAFQYLLSWERAVGKVHPLLKRPATKKTLSFPLDFFPNNLPAGFGDNNGYAPQPFQYAAAKRLKQELVMGAIDRYLTKTGQPPIGLMGASACFCVQHPGTVRKRFKTESRVARVYRGLGWGLIADRMPDPKLFLAMRGGDTKAEHSHVDLLSFRLMVGKEWLIENGRGGEYLHPTYFNKRRTEINDINATYKNTLFINGVGVYPGSVTDAVQAVRGQGCYGVRMIASSAMSPKGGSLAGIFCGRLALMIDDAAIVIIDRTYTRGIARTESRMHSYHDVTFGKDGALIKGEKECLRVSYASIEKAGLFSATTAPATPTDPSATMMRWCPLKLHREAFLATLLTPGRRAANIRIERGGKNFVVRATVKGREHAIRIRPSLILAP